MVVSPNLQSVYIHICIIYETKLDKTGFIGILQASVPTCI